MRLLAALLLALLLATRGAAANEQWPGVYISNQITRATLRVALAGAAGWLAKPGCRSVLEEFRDQSGILLSDRIAELGIDLVTYLERLRFRDGSFAPPCAKPTTVMFTTPGSKVVFVCGRQLERMARQDRGYLSVLVIHEILHTLGLGENPPSSNTITVRVANRCR
jgi:hypothetical protein